MSWSGDVVVLGGGAAGLFCAAVAGQRGRKVAVLERSREPGKKILISGGGRCNFTNTECRPEHFLSGNPHFVRSALARFSAADFIAIVERHGIAYHEKTLGQLFCNGSSRQIVDLLLEECRAGSVFTVVDCDIMSVRAGFVVETSQGEFRAPALVVATGGLSIPKIGATDLGYRLAAQFGVPVVAPRPALVPLVLSDGDRQRWCDLAGVAAECETGVVGADPTFRERFLITHRGLSGPAILQVSSFWQPGGAVRLDLLPGMDLKAALAARRAGGDTATTKTVVADYLPRRFVERWFEIMAAPATIATTSNADFDALDYSLHNWQFVPAGTEGYAKAEVTAGGVDTRELSSTTMEMRSVPGLYFIGEVVDVTGHLGGFNFQWAWASAKAAGDAV